MLPIALDTETKLIAPGMICPRLICMSLAEGERDWLYKREEAIAVFRSLLKKGRTFIGHNIVFDFGVLAAEAPDLLPLIFEAYEQGRVHDTMVRQKLIDIARGELKYRWDGQKQVKTTHHLADLAKYWLGIHLEKFDTYRLRYAELEDVKLEDWPQEAIQYAVDDARVTYQVFEAQNKVGPIPNELEQAKASWVLHLMSMWGVKTDLVATQKLREELEAEVNAAQRALANSGIVREDGSRDLKVLRTRVEASLKRLGKEIPLTEKDSTSTSEETLLETDDPDLLVLARSSASTKLLNTYIPVLERGTKVPICARYNVLVDSGRTSCGDPNMQNPPRAGGVRECFVPRRGFLFCSVDYDTLELRSLAQACLDLVGKSALAEAFRHGEDPHLNLAANLLKISKEEAAIRKKAGDKEIKDKRQFAKIPNFGFPGGLGATSFVDYAKQYGVEITEAEAKHLREVWFTTWFEMRNYFRIIAEKVGDSGEAQIEQLRSKRLRGGVSFTAGANTYFQGLAADGAKEALWNVCREAYLDKSSPLYGSRPVIFVHDEIIAEVPEHYAAEAAERMAVVMRESMQKWLPDIPVTCSPVLMRRWYKDAEPVYKDGKLISWEPK